MSATLVPVRRVTPSQPDWLANADPRDGIRVRVDGATTLHSGCLAEPSCRVDVEREDCAVELCCDGALLRFACLPAGDGNTPPRPGEEFGWSVEGFDRAGCPHRLGVRVGQVLCACAGDREAGGAVEEITLWVAREAELVAQQQPARAATAWRQSARRLRAALVKAQAIRHVPVRPLRDAFLRDCARGELTAREVARRLGWYWPLDSGRPDSARVLRRLGLIEEPSERRDSAAKRALGEGAREVHEQLADATACVTYAVAVELCRGLDRDPADFGCL